MNCGIATGGTAIGAINTTVRLKRPFCLSARNNTFVKSNDMSTQDFTKHYAFEQDAATVFKAVTDVDKWWSEAVEGSTYNEGDEFVYRHGDIHYSKHRLTEVIPGKNVTWLTLDSKLTFVEKQDEWTGTTQTFEIAEADGKTILTFTHLGLEPALQCYKGCTGGWSYYLDSLAELVRTGIGRPDKTS